VWYFKIEVVLTKNNLARRNWNANKLCSFCAQQESIQYLFFYCHFARFLWRAVQVTFNIGIPTSVTHLFNDWANDVGYRVKKFFLIGASVICWALWTSRNEMVFDKFPLKTYMQILYRGTYWLHQWAQLQRHVEHIFGIKEAYRALETKGCKSSQIMGGGLVTDSWHLNIWNSDLVM
jgi:hypothetical protein